MRERGRVNASKDGSKGSSSFLNFYLVIFRMGLPGKNRNISLKVIKVYVSSHIRYVNTFFMIRNQTMNFLPDHFSVTGTFLPTIFLQILKYFN